MDLVFWLEILLFIVLMGLSGFFSSSETSLFSLNQVQLEQMRRDDNPRITLIERMLSQPRRLIMTILIGNEFVNVAASVISAAVVIRLLGPDAKWVNLFVMVPILLVFGEITPKTLAIRNNIAFASFQAAPIEGFSRFISPIRWVVRMVAELFITMILGKGRSRGNIITEDMVRTLAHEAVGQGALDPHEAQFIDQIFDFGNKTLEDVMTPRSNVFFLSADLPLPRLVEELRRTNHTKVPVYRGHRDTILGILYARDLLGVGIKDRTLTPEELHRLLRPAYFVPETKPVRQLFHTFRQRKLSMALIVDEYGGVTGVVTMEDLLECIFGDIRSLSDEHQRVEMERLGPGRFRMPGNLPLEQVRDKLEFHHIVSEAETIGGFLLEKFGELPATNAHIEVDGWVFTVVCLDHNRIETVEAVRVSPRGQDDLPADHTEEEDGTDAQRPPSTRERAEYNSAIPGNKKVEYNSAIPGNKKAEYNSAIPGNKKAEYNSAIPGNKKAEYNSAIPGGEAGSAKPPSDDVQSHHTRAKRADNRTKGA